VLTFKGAELMVQSTSAMTGEAETCIAFTGEARELVVGMNARFILDFLDAGGFRGNRDSDGHPERADGI